jgi:hypothetical protein
MGGLVVDIFIAYVIKASMNMWRRCGSTKWAVSEGVVDSVEESRWWSVHVVSIQYHYDVAGERRDGSDEVNFIKGNSSYEFRRGIHSGMRVNLRVNPADPGASVIAGPEA